MSNGKCARPVHGRWLLLIAAATSALVSPIVADEGQGSSSSDIERYAEDNDRGVDEPVGASRAMGGNDRMWRLDDFPWIYVLFRNPEEKFKAVWDGHPTGYALELTHNIFLMPKGSLLRASTDNGTRLMSLHRAKDLVRFDPSVLRWGVGGNGDSFGTVKELLSLNEEFGIYELSPSKSSGIRPPWRPADESSEGAGSRADDIYKPPEINPQHGFRYYPYWNRDPQLLKNCYLYAFSANDYRGAAEALPKFGLPPLKRERAEQGFQEKEPRYFARWPVKAVACENGLACWFQFDSDRYKEKFNEANYNAKSGQICDTWQDTGAPIMCGIDHKFPGLDDWDLETVWSLYNPIPYEKYYLRLSFVVRPMINYITYPRDYGECSKQIEAWRLADYATEAWEKVLMPYNCKYIRQYDAQKGPKPRPPPKHWKHPHRFPYDISSFSESRPTKETNCPFSDPTPGPDPQNPWLD